MTGLERSGFKNRGKARVMFGQDIQHRGQWNGAVADRALVTMTGAGGTATMITIAAEIGEGGSGSPEAANLTLAMAA